MIDDRGFDHVADFYVIAGGRKMKRRWRWFFRGPLSIDGFGLGRYLRWTNPIGVSSVDEDGRQIVVATPNVNLKVTNILKRCEYMEPN